MNNYIQATKAYISTNKKDLAVGAAVVLSAILAIVLVVLFIDSRTPKVVYQPTVACDLFDSTEAKALLSAKVIKSGSQAPVVSGNTATSKCGYTDGNPDMNAVIVAAVIVRSGVNDDGVQQNKTEFFNGKPTKNVEDVQNIGESAYFNYELGQLNILDGKKWIVLSYGTGAAPETNTVEKATVLAQKVLN